MKTNSDSYTIIYSAILVIIVAFLLAFVSMSLKPKQDANVALDVKKQILYSLNIRDLNDQMAEETYNKVVRDSTVNGLPIYVCDIDGQRKYVIAMKGMGLWGGISGFVSINDDKETVYGAYFNHESETAGLGAEIKDSRAWQEKFQGKKLFQEGVDGIALSVEKKVTEPATQVDAVTGSTLTSNGVRDMLKNNLGNYIEFLKQK